MILVAIFMLLENYIIVIWSPYRDKSLLESNEDSSIIDWRLDNSTRLLTNRLDKNLRLELLSHSYNINLYWA